MGSSGNQESLGSRVRRIRTQLGIGQERLALIAHLDQSGLSKFERNVRSLAEPSIRRIATVLGLSFDQLVDGTDFRGPDGHA
jgi:transcriptional regulator with XRE-family HTH domain